MVQISPRFPTNRAKRSGRRERGWCRRTPRLNVQRNDTLRCRLRLPLLLLLVRSQVLLTLLDRLRVLFLVVAAKQVIVVVLLLSLLSRSFGRILGVHGRGAGFGPIGGVGFRRIAGERGELGLVAAHVLVPAEGVWVFGGGGSAVDAFVGCDVGLGGAVAGGFVSATNSGESVSLEMSTGEGRGGSDMRHCALGSSHPAGS